mgnify:CR=1 FL=1
MRLEYLNSTTVVSNCFNNQKNVRMRKTISLNLQKGLFFTLLWLMSFAVFAQNITVSGVVKDDTGFEVIGATIIIDGDASRGTVTDIDGNYSLSNVPANSSLVISYVGMQTQTIPVNGRSVINVTMAADTELLDEVVVVGYGTQKKVNLTGSVSAVSGEEMLKRPVTNPTTMLQGQMPGVRIVQGIGPFIKK